MINGLVYDFESIKLMLPTGSCISNTSCNIKYLKSPSAGMYAKSGRHHSA